MACGKRIGNVSRLVQKGDRAKDVVRELALLAPGKSHAQGQRENENEPNRSSSGDDAAPNFRADHLQPHETATASGGVRGPGKIGSRLNKKRAGRKDPTGRARVSYSGQPLDRDSKEEAVAYRDLREFVRKLEKEGELKRIRTEVDPVLEIAEITQRVCRPQGEKREAGVPAPRN